MILSKQAAYAPLGLLTVAAMLQEGWKKNVVDMNIDSLRDEDIMAADYIFINAMIVQKKSTKELIRRLQPFMKKSLPGALYSSLTKNPSRRSSIWFSVKQKR